MRMSSVRRITLWLAAVPRYVSEAHRHRLRDTNLVGDLTESLVWRLHTGVKMPQRLGIALKE